MNFTNSDNEFHPPGLFNTYFGRLYFLFCLVKSDVLKKQSVSKTTYFCDKVIVCIMLLRSRNPLKI